MLDPLTALSLVGNIVQFVDFSIKLLGKAHEIHNSTQGSLQENLDAETVAETIGALQIKLRIQDDDKNSDGKLDESLERLCLGCDEIAKELLDVLDKFKVQGKRSPWKSMRQAIKSMKGKTAVGEIYDRLKRFQETLELTILVDLRQKLNLHTLSNSENFENLETSTQSIVLAVLQNRSIFAEAMDAQTAEFRDIQQREAAAATLRHKDAKSTLLATVEDINQLQSHEHGITRQEIQRVACDAANLRAHIDKRTDEIKGLIKATGRAKGTKERVKLAERANAEFASLAAMDLIHSSLMDILAKSDPNYAGHPWKLPFDQSRDSADGTQRRGHRACQPATTTTSSIPRPRETMEPVEVASILSADSSSSFSSLSPSDSGSTVPESRETSASEFEAMTAEAHFTQRKTAEAALEQEKKAAEEEAAWKKRIKDESLRAVLEFKAQREAEEAAEQQAKKAAEERAAWERRLEEEKKAALAKGIEVAKRELEAERKKEEERIAMEKQAEADLRSKHIMIPWPSMIWKRS